MKSQPPATITPIASRKVTAVAAPDAVSQPLESVDGGIQRQCEEDGDEDPGEHRREIQVM